MCLSLGSAPPPPAPQVVHQDGKMIRGASLWLEPRASNDVLAYIPPGEGRPSGSAQEQVAATLDPVTRRWSLSGLAPAAAYSAALQVSRDSSGGHHRPTHLIDR